MDKMTEEFTVINHKIRIKILATLSEKRVNDEGMISNCMYYKIYT